jgi:hypothetical protein
LLTICLYLIESTGLVLISSVQEVESIKVAILYAKFGEQSLFILGLMHKIFLE